MSDEVKNSENPLQEVVQKIVITPEDCSGAADFWTHFEVPMPPELRAAFDNFAKNPSIENQNEVKLQVCNAIAYTDHEAFNDEMFKEIREECRNVVYDMSFDKDLASTLNATATAPENK